METLLRVVLEKISIGKIMFVFLLFALCYIFVPVGTQDLLDSKQIAAMPHGSLKAILFLTGSYFAIEILQQIRIFFKRFEDGAVRTIEHSFEIAKLRKVILELPDEQKEIIKNIQSSESQTLILDMTDMHVNSLLEKRIIHTTDFYNVDNTESSCAISSKYKNIIRALNSIQAS